ncbi:MAG: DUF4131 domain-containing protein, partial [Chitinophagaceae bacterium]
MSRWPLKKAYFWETAPFFRLLLPLVLGIVSYDFQWLPFVSFPEACIGLIISFIVILILGYKREQSSVYRTGFSIALGIFFFLVGWSLYAANDSVRRSDYFGNRLDINAVNLARVVSAKKTRATNRYELELLATVSPQVTTISGKAFLYVFKHADTPGFDAGDTILIPSKWQAITNSGNPFAFSNVAFQRRNNIDFQQFVSPNQVFLAGKADVSKQSFIATIHNFCDSQLAHYVGNQSALGLLRAMLLGDEQGFDP